MTQRYRTTYDRSLKDPEGFWLEAAQDIHWHLPPAKALDDSNKPFYRWYPDAELNITVNALDRHVIEGRGNQLALVYDSAMTGTRRHYTYKQLLNRVELVAGMLKRNGVNKGDRVAIYLPMTPEAVFAMLACARIGAVHSVVFGGFAANELASRLDDATPKVLLTSAGGLEPGKKIEYLPLVSKALDMSTGSVTTVIVKKRNTIDGHANDWDGPRPERWLDWDEELAASEPVGPTIVKSTDPLYILYTSGTTGAPKGIVRDTGGYAVALAWSMKNIYDIHDGQVMWTASDVGWVVGHSYIVYGPLIAGATTLLYEGKPVGTPDAGAFWRVIEEHNVETLFTAPTAIRAIRRVDPDLFELGKYDTHTLRTLFLAGERCDTETYHWINDGLNCPVVDHWWQTETGWSIAANPRGLDDLPIKPGSPSVPIPGYYVEIVDSKGHAVLPDEEGNIVIKLPLPPGTLPTLWGSDERYKSGYLEAFPGYYATGDSGYIDKDGYIYVMGRTDDVINVAGHRLSTGILEEVINGHPSVAEVAVIGVADELKGQRASGFVVLKQGHEIPHDQLTKEVVALVRDQVGPVAAFKDVTVLERLPKTRSGKILRKTMRQIADGEPYKVPPTIEDPTTLDLLKTALGK